MSGTRAHLVLGCSRPADRNRNEGQRPGSETQHCLFQVISQAEVPVVKVPEGRHAACVPVLQRGTRGAVMGA